MLMDQKTNKGLSYINHILRLIKNIVFLLGERQMMKKGIQWVMSLSVKEF
jgi:hypothetical protein